MKRFVVGFNAVLTLLFAAAIGLIHSRPYDRGELGAVLVPPTGCAAPCFLGVQPYRTTLDNALAILLRNQAVRDVQVQDDYAGQTIYWRWQDDQATAHQYAFWVDRQVVTRPILPEGVTLGDVRVALGEADRVTAAYSNKFTRRVALLFSYPAYGLHIFVDYYPCQLGRAAFWHLRHLERETGGYFIGMGEGDYAQMMPASQVEIDRSAWAKQIHDFCKTG
ncbi:MAG: hypothetical protein K8J31_09325 [Anaerolineae bacterium]|nr:hypothetical protein [Anaerolineae bacterium]